MLDFHHAITGLLDPPADTETWEMRAIYKQGGYVIGGAEHVPVHLFDPGEYLKIRATSIPHMLAFISQIIMDGLEKMAVKDGVVFRWRKVDWELGWVDV